MIKFDMKREETIGSRLKKVRLKLKLTIDDVYKDLRIHPKIIEALEKDRIDPNIGEIYIKGFLKKYTRYLGIGTDGILSEFAKKPLFKERAKEIFITNEKEKDLPFIIKDRFKKSLLPLIATISVLFTVSIISYAGFRIIREFNELPFRSSETLTGTDSNLILDDKDNIDNAKASFVVPETQDLVLKVETNDKVWLRVKADGKVIFEHTLSKGSVESWKAKDELELWVGRAEALNLTLNDKHIGSPGHGLIRKVIVDHKGVRIEKNKSPKF